MMRAIICAALGAALLAPASPARAAADAPPTARLPVARLTEPVTLDGTSREAAWERVTPLSFTQLAPVAGAEPTERTELLLGYDDRYLYVAGRLFDREPDKIQSTTKKRDAETASAEWFGIVIDSFNDKENALAFFTTPAGLRWDAAVQNDGTAPPEPLNVDWNADWAVATSRTAEGWFAEFRIPLSSLRFQSVDGQVVIGVISWRQIARKNETVVFPAIPGTWGLMGRFKPSMSREVLLDGITDQKPLRVAPYVLGGARSASVPSGDGQPREIGLDAKYGVTNNVTLDVTINPDFAQVEADDLQMNLSRFALYYPEKRPFFQERSAMFEFSFAGADTLFYSRRIGLDEHGPVRIQGGARVIGRSGGWDFGGLEMQMAPTPQDGAVNVGAARARRQVRNASSYVGGMVTTRVAGDGADNVAYGLDTQLRLQGNDYLQAAWAQSITPGREFSGSSVEQMRAAVRYERRVMVGTGFEASASYAGRAYDPALGFQSRSDVSTAFVSFGHGWVPPAASPVLIYRAGAVASATLSNTRGVIESAEGGPLWGVRSKSGYRVSLAPRLSLEDLAGPMPIAHGAGVPAGRHQFLHLLAIVETPATRLLSVSMMSDTGAFYDGRRTSILLSPRWQALPDVEVGGSYQLEDLVFPSRREQVTNHTTRLRIGYMPSTRVSFSALVQHSSLQRSLGANLRMRYNPREGVDLWIVYDHAGTSLDGAIPGSTTVTRNSTFVVKYTYTLRTTVKR